MPAETPPPPVVVVVGPTAVGKSGFALALAEAGGGEIVNADALQAYRRLDIGTAKPTPEERRRVPHHLFDVLDPEETYSAGDFARRARPLLDELRARETTPIVVGGSGLYVRALLDGLDTVPRDLAERARLAERHAAEGLAPLHAELLRLDPETAARLAPGDTQRILRALEVTRSTGVPMSRWIRRKSFDRRSVPAVRLGLTLPRDVLYDRISLRVRRMVERGWVGEVEAILEEGIDPAAPAFQAIGYRQIVRHVRGEQTLAAAVDDIVRATRRYAKRQLTWFRRERDVRWIDAAALPEVTPGLARRILAAPPPAAPSSESFPGGLAFDE